MFFLTVGEPVEESTWELPGNVQSHLEVMQARGQKLLDVQQAEANKKATDKGKKKATSVLSNTKKPKRSRRT